MNTQNVLLSPEVVAAIISVAATSAVYYGVYLYNSRRANRVILLSTGKTSLISTSTIIKDNLKILYKDKNVSELYLYEFELYNSGNVDINDVEIYVQVENLKESGFLEVEAEDKQKKVEFVNPSLLWKNESEIASIKVTRPFLNSLKRYKEEKIKLRIYSDSKLNFSVIGGGKSWCTAYKDVQALKADKDRRNNFLNLGIALVALISYFAIFLPSIIGTSATYLLAAFFIAILLINFAKDLPRFSRK